MGFPKRLTASSAAGSPIYILEPALIALHQGARVPNRKATVDFPAERIAVYPREAVEAVPKNARIATSPVYRLGEGGPIAVPTGLVFVRLQEALPIDTRRDQLQRAGFQLIEPAPKAPHAGWVQATDGGIAAALSSLKKLAALAEVVHVEPQMLRSAERK
jgi:hypothetical protein